MNFVSADYAAFLLLVFTAWWLERRHAVPRLLLLLGSSLYFYGYWNWKYVPLLLASTVVDYLLAGAIANSGSPRRKRLLITVSLVLNLGVLAAFKYWAFFAENLALLGLRLPVLDVLLPPGISFYTFQSLSYTIDVYRGSLRPARNLLEFATYIAYFPQLVAGPIVRASDFLPQFLHVPRVTQGQLQRGLAKIAVGLIKKVLVADTLALGIVDAAFADGSQVGGLHAFLAVWGYALQIYGDFSGYSDIAIGSALLFGFEIQENFDAPYAARNVQEFWRRWHISLSTWLRDYVYIPLGGGRGSKARKYLNLWLTMVICGIWHGAAWSFVIFGIVQGLAVVATHIWLGMRGKKPGDVDDELSVGKAVAVLVTFVFTSLTFVLIRAPLGKAILIYRQLFVFSTFTPNLHRTILLIIGGGLLVQWFPRNVYETVRQLFIRAPAAVQAACLFAVAIALREAASTEAVPFVYFQF